MTTVPYEVHVTVDSDDVDGWVELCKMLEIKPLYIELSSGRHRHQLMCAAVLEGEHASALAWAQNLVADIQAAGFVVLRTKLECMLDKSGYIKDAAYYESHMKLMLTEVERGRLDQICLDAGVHASRNLLSSKSELQKWYLTARRYNGDFRAAAEKFNRVMAIVSGSLPSVRMEMECVIYDTNHALDAGWAMPS